MPGHVEFEFSFAKNTPKPSRRGDSLRILLVGDFRGAAREDGADDMTAPMAVDIDNFDKRMAALAPAADVTDARGAQHRIRFTSLESFHPDDIYARVDAFRAEPSASPAAAEPAPDAAPATGSAQTKEDDEDTFSRLLGQPADAPKQTRAKGMLDSFIKNLVDDDAVAPDTHGEARTAGAAAAHSEQMRAILHAPQFQRLEAAWRGLYDLVSELETGETLHVFMLDVGDDALRKDLDADDYNDSDLFRMLVREDHGRFGGQAWHIIACDMEFTAADVRRLGTLGAVAAAAGGVIIAGAGALDDTASRNDSGLTFTQLRGLPVAEHIGLVAPRVLLRLPYGAKSDAIDAFKFEECDGRPADDELLWGSAAPLLARCLGQAFEANGFAMSPGGQIDIADRPAYAFTEGGERHLADVAAQSLSDSEAEALLSGGVIAVVAQRDGNRLLLPRVQSIAQPARALRGAWA